MWICSWRTLVRKNIFEILVLTSKLSKLLKVAGENGNLFRFVYLVCVVLLNTEASAWHKWHLACQPVYWWNIASCPELSWRWLGVHNWFNKPFCKMVYTRFLGLDWYQGLTSCESSSEAFEMASSSLVSFVRLSLQAFLAASCFSSLSL